MKKTKKSLLTLLVLAMFLQPSTGLAQNINRFRELERQARIEQDKGNVGDALRLYRRILEGAPHTEIAYDEILLQACICMQQAGQVDMFDAFLENVLKQHKGNAKVMLAAVAGLLQVPRFGYIVAGEFQRGESSGGGERVSSLERDRVMALRLLLSAMPVAEQETEVDAKRRFYRLLIETLRLGRDGADAWKLQYLTDIRELPSYDSTGFEFYMLPRAQPIGAPVDADGKPIFYGLPSAFNQAVNDGERWCFALHQASRYGCGNALWEFADFLYGQFGVQTLHWYFNYSRLGDIKTGPFAVHLLKENETIARLADGPKKFTLPEEFNYIAIFRQIADSGTPVAEAALMRLADIFSNRRQHERAAEYLRKCIIRFGKGEGEYRQKQLDQIVGGWAEFLPVDVFAAGNEPEINFKYRNASEITFSLHPLNVAAYLETIKNLLRSGEGREELARRGMSPQDIGRWLLEKDGRRFVGKQTIDSWKMRLDPLPGHFDQTGVLRLPVTDAGTYLLEGKVRNGNTIRLVVWLGDLAVIERPGNAKRLVMVVDAATGSPVSKCRLEFFGYRLEYIRSKAERENQERYKLLLDEFTAETDDRGMYLLDERRYKPGFNYLIQARHDERYAVLGFSHFQRLRATQSPPQGQAKIYCITDRPLYRPGQPVRFKYWLRHINYGGDSADFIRQYAKQQVTAIITSPRGNKIMEKTFTTDANAAFDGEFVLPSDAELGRYAIHLEKLGGAGSFLVEEYRKPEYEVKIKTPEKPVLSGEKFTVEINADYYFGAPVAEAELTYKVFRNPVPEFVPFSDDWQWLYGDATADVQRFAPSAASFFPRQPPELVTSGNGVTDRQGRFKIDIGTASAKILFGEQDSRYEIVAEVTAKSRQTIVGRNEVVAAAQPFRVSCSADRRHYRPGDIATITVRAESAERRPVGGELTLLLYRLEYNVSGEPDERMINTWSFSIGDNGTGKVKFQVPGAGSFRAVATVVPADGVEISDSVVLRCTGETMEKLQLTELPLEIIADKPFYAPGDEAKLLLTSAFDSPVLWWFVRPDSTVSDAPQLIEVKGKSLARTLKITAGDMPNFFVEAWTVRRGRLYSAVQELRVPPADKMLQAVVAPLSQVCQPRQKCMLKFAVTDKSGKPVKSRLAVAVYDKALEYLSGGSNVPDITAFFWKWTRRWFPRHQCSLNKRFASLLAPDEPGMMSLGVFGNLPSPFETKTAGMGLLAVGGRQATAATADLMMAAAPENAAPLEKQPAVLIRKDFADSAMWRAVLDTDAQGKAELEFPLPDNLTTWKVKVWAMADGCRVGQGEAEVQVSKDFSVRIAAPRSLSTDDTATISTLLYNRLDRPEAATVTLDIDGEECLRLKGSAERKVNICKASEERVDWQVSAHGVGNIKLTAKATAASGAADAMQLALPINIRGINRQSAFSVCIAPSPEPVSSFVTLDVPEKRIEGSTRLVVQFAPSTALAIVNALPHLTENDGKDVFSVVNRFVPAAATLYCLGKLGFDPDSMQPPPSLNPFALDTPPASSSEAAGFNPRQVNAAVKQGIETLTGMQNGDGGWGWFSGFRERSHVDTTATVVGALMQVAALGIEVDPQVLQRGVQWLQAYQQRRYTALQNSLDRNETPSINNIDALVFLTTARGGAVQPEMGEILFQYRQQLSLYGLSLCGLAFARLEDQDKLKIIMENLEQFLVEDWENQTVYLRQPRSAHWWRWDYREIETQAAYLRLLASVAPDAERTARLAKYLLINRQHAVHWDSVTATGMCINALCEFLVAGGELAPDMTVEIKLNGQLLKEAAINPDNLFSGKHYLVVGEELLNSGTHSLEIRRRGKGTLYFGAFLSCFTMEDFIQQSGLDLKVERRYYRLEESQRPTPVAGVGGKPLHVFTEQYKRIPLDGSAQVNSGDLLEAELIIEAKNDYSYLLFKDPRPSGCEPAEPIGGYTANAINAFVEFRDNATAFYVRRLPRGKYSVFHRMRAVFPGIYHALPASGTGIYASELKANSASAQIHVSEFNLTTEDSRE